jgi:hypothetical protein
MCNNFRQSFILVRCFDVNQIYRRPNPILDIQLTGERDESGRNSFYLPIIYPNDFWHLRSCSFIPRQGIVKWLPSKLTPLTGEQEMEINATYPSNPKEKLVLPLTVNFYPLSYMKMQLYASMTHGFEEAAKTVSSPFFLQHCYLYHYPFTRHYLVTSFKSFLIPEVVTLSMNVNET